MKRDEVIGVLEGVKSDGNGGWLASCPVASHGRGRGDRTPSLHVNADGDTVLYHCLAGCSQKDVTAAIRERLRTLQPRPIPLSPPRPAPATLSVEATKETELNLRGSPAVGWLQSRGIAEGVAKALRFGYARKFFRCGARCGLCREYPALVIPSFWDGKLIGIKYRNLEAPDRQHKWIQESGSKQNFIFQADASPDYFTMHPGVVCVTEGPLDAALLLSLGFNAVAIASAEAVPDSKQSATDLFLESVERLKKNYTHIALIGDQDEPGQAAMYRLGRIVGPGAAHVPLKLKDVGDAWRAEQETFAQDLDYLLGLVEQCTSVPRPEDEATAEERVSAILREGLRRVGHIEIKSLAEGLASQLRKTLPDENFPAALAEAALHGVVGEFVEAVSPYTESDVPSLVFQALPALGNLFGLRRFAGFGAERHYPQLFSLVVGKTSSGKGQAWSNVRALLKIIDPDWLDTRCRSSAASGEGLVRLCSQAGAADPRLLLNVTEMALVLSNMAREGSNLSAYLRMAYDRTPLENLKSRAEIVAKDYVLGCVGQITPQELAEKMAGVDWSNGIANRFLWCATRRARTIPRMEQSPDLGAVAERIRNVLRKPEGMLAPPENLRFSDRAGVVWDEWYNALPVLEGRLEASQGRVAANALRVTAVYACLDGAARIEETHVRAAIAITDYSRATVEWVLKLADANTGQDEYREIVRLRMTVNRLGGQISGRELANVFSHRNAKERAELASKVGLRLHKVGATGGRGGKEKHIWSW